MTPLVEAGPARCVIVVERPDQDGHRWARALDLLLEAGRRGEEDEDSR